MIREQATFATERARLSATIWWHERTRLGKAILIVCVFLLVQIGLAISSRYTVFPLYDALTHSRIEEEERGTGLLFVLQLMLCLPTVAILLAMVIAAAIRSWLRSRTITTITAASRDTED